MGVLNVMKLTVKDKKEAIIGKENLDKLHLVYINVTNHDYDTGMNKVFSVKYIKEGYYNYWIGIYTIGESMHRVFSDKIHPIMYSKKLAYDLKIGNIKVGSKYGIWCGPND